VLAHLQEFSNVKPAGPFERFAAIHRHDIFRSFQTLRHRPRPLVSSVVFFFPSVKRIGSAVDIAPGGYVHQGTGFVPMAAYIGFVVDKMAFGEPLIHVLLSSINITAS
jgi:hypothetical protein